MGIKNNISEDWVETILGKLPSDWKIVNAENYCQKVADGTHDSPKKTKTGKLLVTSKNIKNSKLDLNSAYHISNQDFEDVNKRSLVSKWDVLLSMIGTVGEVCLIHQEPDFAIKNVGLFKVGNETKSRWLFYFLKSKIGQNYIFVRLSGTTQQYITLRELRELPVPVPPLPEQKAIAKVLTAFDDKIELLQAQNKTLETMAQTIFKEWFGKYQIGDELPEGWREYELGDVCNLSAGGDKPKNSTSKSEGENIIPIYSNGIKNEGLYGFTNNASIFDESVTVSARGTIGYVCLRPIPYVPIVRLVSVIPDKNYLSAKFLFYFLKNNQILGTGTTQQQLTIPDFKLTRIIIPNSRLMDDFTQIINTFYIKIYSCKNQIQSLTKTRDTLLPKLMSGQVRVKNVKQTTNA
jgi:type I restriction enzyme, S subunit